jgi:hypothetical protein
VAPHYRLGISQRRFGVLGPLRRRWWLLVAVWRSPLRLVAAGGSVASLGPRSRWVVRRLVVLGPLCCRVVGLLWPVSLRWGWNGVLLVLLDVGSRPVHKM